MFQESLAREKEDTASRHVHVQELNEPECGDPIGYYDEPATLDAFPITRSKLRSDATISTPELPTTSSQERETSEDKKPGP